MGGVELNVCSKFASVSDESRGGHVASGHRISEVCDFCNLCSKRC